MTLMRQAVSFHSTFMYCIKEFRLLLKMMDGHEGLEWQKSDYICILNLSSNRVENELKEYALETESS